MPNPNQPRKDFDPDKLKELAENIKAVGLKQPIIIRPLPTTGGKFQIVDGERRYRACKLIDLKDVPVEIREDIKTEEDVALQSFIINNERSGYSPQDKDAYIFNLYQTTKLSTRKLAEKLGKHHSFVDHAIEAHHFRQRLPPTLVGTLPLTHAALRETAFIKDDKLRIRFLKMIADGKLRLNAVRDVYQLLQKIPADREEVFEAYSLGMLTSDQIQFLSDGAPHGKNILLKPQETLARWFTGQIPEDVKKRLLYVTTEKREKPLLEDVLKEQKKKLEQWLAAAEPDKNKQEEIRRSHHLQTYDTPDNIHDHFERYSIESIKREFEPKTKEEAEDYSNENTQLWRAIQWWLATRLDHHDKIRQIKTPELAIAVIDLVTEVIHWEALKRSLDEQERKYEEWQKGGDE